MRRVLPWISAGIASQLEEDSHLNFILRSKKNFLLTNKTFYIEVAEGLVHRDHADILAGLHDAGEHEGLAVADRGGDDGRLSGDCGRLSRRSDRRKQCNPDLAGRRACLRQRGDLCDFRARQWQGDRRAGRDAFRWNFGRLIPEA